MSQKPIEIPEIFEGKRTRYTLFDGCRTLGVSGKILYLTSLFATAMVIPLMFEFFSYAESQETAKKAELYVYGITDEKGNLRQEYRYLPNTATPSNHILQRMLMS